jgi:asparagine N-glycosylation enzyme membrane subunit Stt3
MCAERIQRFLMAIMLTIAMVLMAMGPGMVGYGVMLQSFIIFVVIIWALTDFCPSLWVFEKIFGSCRDK